MQYFLNVLIATHLLGLIYLTWICAVFALVLRFSCFFGKFSRSPTQCPWSYNFPSSLLFSVLVSPLPFFHLPPHPFYSSMFSPSLPTFFFQIFNCDDSALSLKLLFFYMDFHCLTRHESSSLFHFSVVCPWAESFRISVFDYEDFMTVHMPSI